MIAFAKTVKKKGSAPAWQQKFLEMLPAIRRAGQFAFRFVPAEVREDLVEEVIANSFVAYSRIAKTGKADLVGPTPLARYAIAQIRTGRRVGNRLRIRDAMSGYAQYRKAFSVASLDHYDREEDQWQEIILEDRRAGPAEIAACKIDFENWLSLLPRRQRKIALTLASGENTRAAAKTFGVTPARISQLRLWLKESWQRFQDEACSPLPASASPVSNVSRLCGSTY